MNIAIGKAKYLMLEARVNASPSSPSGPTKNDLVYLLGQFIAEQSLEPGDRLPSIRNLADQFSVKPGLVRDALLDAQGKGMVKLLPRAGAFVQFLESNNGGGVQGTLGERLKERLPSRVDDLFHMVAARELLEVELASLAARRCEAQDLLPLRRLMEEMAEMDLEQRRHKYTQIDVEFHLEIARLSGNTVMAAMLRVLLEQLIPMLQEISWSKKRSEQTDKAHSRIYFALLNGSEEDTRRETRNHIQVAYNALLECVRRPTS